MTDDASNGRWPWDRQPAEQSGRRRRRRLVAPLVLSVVFAAWCGSFYEYTRTFHSLPGPHASLLAPEARGALIDIAAASATRLLAPLLHDATPRRSNASR